MAVVEAALLLPYHDVKHPTFGTVMRMLDKQVRGRGERPGADKRVSVSPECFQCWRGRGRGGSPLFQVPGGSRE